MPKIFCICGLGTDEHIFKNIHVEGYQLIFIKWITPLTKESLANYATRISSQINEPNPIILAVSFGGLLAIELSKIITVKKIFLVSGIKNSLEKTSWLKTLRFLPLYKFVTPSANSFFEPIQNYNLGANTLEEKQMARNYRKNVDRSFLKWAINIIINWKHTNNIENVIHIHGTNDKLFPIKNLNVHYKIKGGTHMMIYNKSEEINLLLTSILS